jgi:hypothetical protein
VISSLAVPSAPFRTSTTRQTWLKRVDTSSHGTTHEIPVARLEKEGLKQMGGIPVYVVNRECLRKVSRDAYLSYNGNRYSVPYRFAGRDARLQIRANRIKVYVGSEQICEHEIMTGNGRHMPRERTFSRSIVGGFQREQNQDEPASLDS